MLLPPVIKQAASPTQCPLPHTVPPSPRALVTTAKRRSLLLLLSFQSHARTHTHSTHLRRQKQTQLIELNRTQFDTVRDALIPQALQE